MPTTGSAELFARLTDTGTTDETVTLDGMNVRMVCVAGGGAGRWDSHANTPETVMVWSGDFDVAFRDHTVSLTAGQCCAVPVNTEHRGTSRSGAEVVLFTQVA